MIAIYARQSVERPDSISIAMQVEHCRRICPAEAEDSKIPAAVL